MYLRQDQALVTVVLDGVDLGTFNKKGESGVESDNTQYPPGGMAKKINLGGPTTEQNITFSRALTDTDDWAWIKSRCGKGSIVATEQLLDEDQNPVGARDVTNGVLLNAKKGDFDAGGNDPRSLELEVGPN